MPQAPSPAGSKQAIRHALPRLAAMRVRDLTTEDFLPYRRLSGGAFGGPIEDAPSAAFDLAQIPLGIDSGALPHGAPGELAAAARVRRDQVTVGGGTAACGGISGLAVHPAHRGDGLFRELLTAVIARCCAEDMVFSMLYPSNPGIYRSLGYQTVTSVRRVLVPLLDLQRLRPVPGRRLVPVTETSLHRIHSLHRELTAKDNAMLIRQGPLFPAGLPKGAWSALLLVDEAGRDRGYISWTRRADDADGIGLDVHDIFGRDREDLEALLHSLGSWSTVTQTARIRLRTEDPLLDVLPGAGTRPDPDPLPLVMMRVIDTAAALRARPAPMSLRGRIRLRVSDDTVPPGTCRSAGDFLVSIGEGRVRVDPASDLPPGDHTEPSDLIELDIHAASLLLIGGRSLADARRLGLHAQGDGPAQRLFDEMLAGPRPSVLETF